MRRLLLVFALFSFGARALALPEIAPVASYFQFGARPAAGEGPQQWWDLWIIRPQFWDDGIPRDVEILTSGDGSSNPDLTPRPLPADGETQRRLHAENRAIAEFWLRNVYQFRLAQVLRDFGVASEEALPEPVREELWSIKSGQRAFAVLTTPGGMGTEAIQLTLGVAYEYPTGILAENRLKGRGVLANGKVFQGLYREPLGLERFTDREFRELGPTKGPVPFYTDRLRGRSPALPREFLDTKYRRYFLAGARAELTTFARTDAPTEDLVPAIQQFLITMGVTRFGLTEVSERDVPMNWSIKSLHERMNLAEDLIRNERELAERGGDPTYQLPEYRVSNYLARIRRISLLSVEAISRAGGKNPLSRMYRDMGFRVTHRFPSDPDFPEHATDLLEMSAEDFEHALSRRLRQRPGGRLLDAGELIPKFIYYGPAYPNGSVLPPVFFLQPAHDRIHARRWLRDLLKDAEVADGVARRFARDPKCLEMLGRLHAGDKRG